MPGPSRGSSDGSRGGGLSAGDGSSFLFDEQETASRQRSSQVKCRYRRINRPPQGEIESTRRLACLQRKVSRPADLYLSIARGYGEMVRSQEIATAAALRRGRAQALPPNGKPHQPCPGFEGRVCAPYG